MFGKRESVTTSQAHGTGVAEIANRLARLTWLDVLMVFAIPETCVDAVLMLPDPTWFF